MPFSPNWTVPVLTCSALEKTGVEAVWQTVNEHRDVLMASGELEAKRKAQAKEWFRFLLDDGLKNWFYNDPEVLKETPLLLDQIENEQTSPTAAAATLLSLLQKK